MPLLHTLTAFLGFIGLGVAVVYSALTLVALYTWRRRRPERASRARPPVTLLKPLCGTEPGLYEHLRGFCCQDYPDYQIIFGVRDPADPACEVARRLAAEFPELPIDLVIDPRQHGGNRKTSNLINMLEHARHDFLVMSDSDTFVGSDYLASVTAPLLDDGVGLVTCAYRGVPTSGLWSRLGAMYINEWYVPSVLVAWLFGYESYVSGQTICIRRTILQAIGGLRAIADHLADDHRLGELVRERGLRIELSPYVVDGEHHEQSFESLMRHELRWMHTIRILRPLSFRLLFLSFSFPLAVLGLLLVMSVGSLSPAAWALFAGAAGTRWVMHVVHCRDRRGFAELWLLPLRDLLLCSFWCCTFFTSRLVWRGTEFDVDAGGLMRRLT